MTPEEISLLREFGYGLYLSTIQWICTCLIYGIYGFLAIFSVYLIARSPWTKHTTQYILISGLGLGAVAMIFNITINFIATFSANSAADKSLQVVESQVAQALHAAGDRWFNISTWASILLVCLDDFIIAWRAYSLWTGQVQPSPLFGFFMAAYFGFQIYAHIVASHPLVWNIIVGGSTLTLNIVGTALIGIKTWAYQKWLNKNQGIKYHTLTPSQKVLLTWLESGCCFCMLEALWLLAVCLSSANTETPMDIFNAVAQGFRTGGLGLYPVIVFIMVKLRLSATEEIISPQPGRSIDGELHQDSD